MNWFRQNRFLGVFLAALTVATLASLVFGWMAKSGFDEAKARFDENASELNRLQRLTPFPTKPNVAKMKTQADEYAAELNRTKEELKTHVLPVTAMAPNEFQARLRQAMAAVNERARANRVKLPDNFYLGFEEFAAALPDNIAAPLLGQQLAQVELLVNTLIDARVDAISSLKRVRPAEQRAGATPAPTASPAGTPHKATTPLIERNSVEATFVSNPGAARRALNQITSTPEQVYVIRTLHILNEKDKGPPRAPAVVAGVSPAAGSTTPGDAAGTAAPTGAATGASSNPALTFIVGNERVQTSARIEMLRFNFP